VESNSIFYSKRGSSLTDEDDDFGGVDEIEIEKYIP